jgi:quercetin dioxygenase-like cupin family protein
MKIFDSKKFLEKGGWFIGNFEPSVIKTDLFEISYKTHNKDEFWPKHHHKKSDEINYLIRGKMKINNVIIEEGKIFVIEKNESIKPIFLENCEMIVIKIPSTINDKHIDNEIDIA